MPRWLKTLQSLAGNDLADYTDRKSLGDVPDLRRKKWRDP
jgi:hypothetical protein